jgi:hypothetical protein
MVGPSVWQKHDLNIKGLRARKWPVPGLFEKRENAFEQFLGFSW